MLALLKGAVAYDPKKKKKKRHTKKSSHPWLVPVGVHHHPPVGAVAAVAETELLHEDFVFAVLPSLDDQPLHQLLLAKIHL